jgi:threonine/homoserine/homoserine lactone efflux protein
MAALFFQSLLIGYSGAIMPGSMLTYTIDKSIRNGAKSGFILSLGHSLLELILVIVIFAGAGKYLETGPVRTIIGIVGGILLVYLGFDMIKEVYMNKISLDTKGSTSSKQSNIFFAGIALSATNPFFIIWWSVVGLALIMSSYNSFGTIGIAVFYIGHILSDISWFTFISVLVSKTRHLIRISIFKTIIAILGVCLIGIGISFFIGSAKLILKI